MAADTLRVEPGVAPGATDGGIETAWPRAERRFRAMGTDAHVLVVGPRAAALADRAADRISDLEARWSRFLPTSEISRLNRRAGHPVALSDDSFRLVETAAAARRLTRGRFDPTLGAELAALGYDRPLDQVLARPAPGPTPPPPAPLRATATARAANRFGPEPVTVDPAAGTATLAPGRSFDPGGIGKGLAADLVVDELLAGGGWGALVNLGGDLRVAGVPPSGPTWVVAIDHPHLGPLTTVELTAGGLATSTTLRRRWPGPDGDVHHLLDPTTGRPHRTGADHVTVIAGTGWWAEAAATALIGTPLPSAVADPTRATLLPAGCAALLVDPAGRTRRLGGFESFERPHEPAQPTAARRGTEPAHGHAPAEARP